MDSITSLFPYQLYDQIDHKYTFAQFLNLIEKFKIDPSSNISIVGIKSGEPLEFLAKILAVLLSGKKALLLPKNLYAFEQHQINETLEFTFYEKLKAFPHDNQIIPKDAEIIFLSSGSTSTPVGYGHRMDSFKAHFALFKQFFNPKGPELYAMNLPLNHVGGMMLLWRAICSGGKISNEISNQVDYLSLVPAQVEKMLQDQNNVELLKNLKALFIGGGIFSDKLKDDLNKLQIKYFETYGMTETLSFIALNQKLLDGISVNILDDQTIVIDSPTLFYCSYKNRKIEIRSGIYQTSDLGSINNGYINFLGRKDKIYKSGGEKVSKNEVEALLFKHTKLSSFIVGSVKDAKWEDMVVALCEDDVDTDLMREKLKKVAPPHLIPRFFLKKNPLLLNSIKITQKDIYKHYLFQIFDHRLINRNAEKTLVVLHGFMEDYNDFQFIEDHFIEYNILLINLPGHGNTKLNHFYSLQDLTEKLSDFLLFIPNDLYLIGYSMGGRVASLLTQLPHLKGLILISSGLGLKNEEEKYNRLKNDHELFKRFDNNHDFFHNWYGQNLFGNYQKLPSYHSALNKKMELNLEIINQSLDILSPGVFPLEQEILDQLSKFQELKVYIYGRLDLKYSNLSNDYKKIGFKTLIIEDAFHNLHKTHESDLLQNLKCIL